MTKFAKSVLIPIRCSGVDVGNNSTKTSEGVCIPSQVARGENLDKNALAIKAKWRDQFFIAGNSKEAVKFRDTQKIYTDEYKVCLLIAMALSYPEYEINAVVSVGLPYDEWQGLKDVYREEILKLKNEEITIYMNEDDKVGVTKTISIKDCTVTAEGDILDFISDDELPAMVIDFGGKTLDATMYTLTRAFENGKPVNKINVEGKTDALLGFDNELDKIKQGLNAKGYTVDTDQELISILLNDTLKTFNGEIDLKRIRNNVLNVYCHRVLRHMKNLKLEKFPNVKFIGGCAELIKFTMEDQEIIKSGVIEVLDNSQFFNALNYKEQATKIVDNTKYYIVE